MYKQWERKIEDSLLRRSLMFVKDTIKPKKVIVAVPDFLQVKYFLLPDLKESLVLIIQQRLLITCYWCKDVQYLCKKESNVYFEILKVSK